MKRKLVYAIIILAPFIFSALFGAISAYVEKIVSRTYNAPLYFATDTLIFLCIGGILAFIAYYVGIHRDEYRFFGIFIFVSLLMAVLAVISWFSYLPWVFALLTYIILFIGAYLFLAFFTFRRAPKTCSFRKDKISIQDK